MSGIYPYYIITGPPSSGKTTIINELIKRGFTCHQEVARQIIKENQKAGINYFPWNNMHLFSDQVFKRKIKHLNTLNGNLCFFDRSIIDLIAYLEINNVYDNDKYRTAILNSGYQNNVFYLPFWNKIYLQDFERKESKIEAIQIGKKLKKVYSEFGYNLTEVPFGKVEERVEYILGLII